MLYVVLLYIPALIRSQEKGQQGPSSVETVTADSKLQHWRPRPADFIRREGGHRESNRREKFAAGSFDASLQTTAFIATGQDVNETSGLALETRSSNSKNLALANAMLFATPATITGFISGFVFILLAIVAIHENADASSNPRPTECWTGIRAVVSTWIFVEHATSILWEPDQSLRMPASGAFFVLSGAALGLDRTFEHSWNLRDYFFFLAKRLGRVLPPYWLALALARAEGGDLSFFRALITYPYEDWVSFFAMQTWTGRPLLFHWFVSCIVQVYLLYPLISIIFTLIGTRRHLSRCAIVCCIAYSLQWATCLWLWAFPVIHPGNGLGCKYLPREFFGRTLLVYQNFIFRSPEFILGSMVSHAMSVLDDADKSGKSLLSVWQQRMLPWLTDLLPVLMLGLAVIARVQISAYSDASDCGHFLIVAVFMNLASPLWCLWLFGMAYCPAASWSQQVLSSKYFLAFGQASYGVYVYSIFIIQQSNNIGTAYIMTMSVALSSFYVIEMPISRLIRSTLQRQVMVNKNSRGFK